MPEESGAQAAVVDTAVTAYVLRLGDDALIASHRLAELVARAPQLEEDVALANISLDLLGQARALLGYAGRTEEQLTGVLRTEDDLAYLRAENQFVNCRLVELPNTDFAHTTARQLLFSGYAFELYSALTHSTDETIAGIAGKAVKELSYHRDHAARWTIQLGDGTDESARRMAAALEAAWPYVDELFAADDVTRTVAGAGVGADPARLRPAWDAFVDGVLEPAGLERPEVPPITGLAGKSGRDGVHSEAFGFLVAEMQHLHRSHPGASW
ncbi:ring-1,2-phenylacetyl-CoA epoxidase subunit PaaC [Lipingzhangella halophila]|uniref:Ring-1,2-phenylacetyl-CoA epoxidase subunit PaaC n=1 Tax=Lipingzhangella halophila TaxID=1783352 RepID=A0A7W7RCP5_9ACTN|nr:1,2-phenylacetyl-CoA epoxidase subunit PaaC [Lipingzhangella halophila]MBB4929499.1 ring-1,2-phenylacetyl-CoA epoxidase subunit PaaC [Lipingzhangella halophila]